MTHCIQIIRNNIQQHDFTELIKWDLLGRKRGTTLSIEKTLDKPT